LKAASLGARTGPGYGQGNRPDHQRAKGGLVQDFVRVDVRLDSFDMRINRAERRLELSDSWPA
jgi:hypothetical protein